jgi:hypothetical protein
MYACYLGNSLAKLGHATESAELAVFFYAAALSSKGTKRAGLLETASGHLSKARHLERLSCELRGLSPLAMPA